MDDKLTIGKLAWLAKVNVETIRYYQRRGLLETPDKPLRGHRHYPETTLKRLHFIKQAQALGFSLEEIHTLTDFDKRSDCSTMKKLLEWKKDSVEQQLSQLNKIHVTLGHLLCHCDGKGCSEACPVIDNLAHMPCQGLTCQQPAK